MDDLLDKFSDLLSQYEACRAKASAASPDDYQLINTHAKSKADEICRFLIKHDATVTFPAPPAAPFNPNANYVRKETAPGRWNWVQRTEPDGEA